MASTELVVAFSAQVSGLETSLKRVNSRLDDLVGKSSQTASKIESDMSAISRAFSGLNSGIRAFAVAYAALESLRGLANLAVAVDDINASLTRLQVLTGSSRGNVEQLFASFNALGSQTGQSVSSLADQFTRFYVATQGIGASQGQVQQLVDTLARFAQVSGRGPQESAAAITQLAQGLASGRLQGDELKSILENMPPLAAALARQLGVGVGELRKMGEEGQLTADVVFPALLRAGADLGTRLQNIPLSLRQSFQVAMDGLLRAVREIDSAIGASAWLSRALQYVGSVGQSVGVAVSGGAPGAEAQRYNEGIIAQDLERRRTIEREILEIRTQMANADERARNVLQGQINLRQQELSRLPEASRNVSAVDAAIRNAALAVEGTYEDTIRFYDGQRERAQQNAAALARISAQVDERERVRQDAQKRRDEVTALARQGVERSVTDNLIRMIDEKERADLASIARREGAEDRRADSAARAQAARDREEARAREAQARLVGGQDRSPLRDMEERFLRLTERPVGRRQSAIGEFIDQTAVSAERLNILFGALESSALRAAEELVRAGENPQPAFDALRQQMQQVQDILAGKGVQVPDFDVRVNASVDRIEERLARLRDRTETTWRDIAVKGVSAFSQDLAGSLVDFAATGEQKFAEMAANFTKMVAKMILEFLILEAIILGVSAATGGSINLRRRQAGGPVSAGQPYIVGEKRPELFVPSSSGYIYPSVDQGGGGTVVNVYNQAQGTTTRQQERTNGLGGKEIDIYIEQVVQRGIANGRFDTAMGQSFGASRAGRV